MFCTVERGRLYGLFRSINDTNSVVQSDRHDCHHKGGRKSRSSCFSETSDIFFVSQKELRVLEGASGLAQLEQDLLVKIALCMSLNGQDEFLEKPTPQIF